MADSKTVTTRKKKRAKKFDPSRPRAVNMKVKCGAKSSNAYGYDLSNGERCGAVYLRIMENETNATPMDLKTTHTKCPMCGSEKFENLTNWELSKDKTRVVVKPSEPI